MEYPFSSKEKGMGNWASPKTPPENSGPNEAGLRNSGLDDPFNNISELMNFDNYAGWCTSPPVSDPIFNSYPLQSVQSMHSNYSSFDALNFSEQNNTTFPISPFNFDNQFGYPLDSSDTGGPGSKRNPNSNSGVGYPTLSRPHGYSLPEKMLRALSMFKESSGGGILAQVWVPIKLGDQYILSTCEQPYLLDQMLAGYREVSRDYTFSAERNSSSFNGLPGRVFISKIHEWTSNVNFYNKSEYLRAQHAANHEVRGSIAIPIFNLDEKSCCAVLELVTMKEKVNFNSEMENVCRALQAVNLRTSAPPRLHLQSLSKNQRAAVAEITDILRAVCHAHRLPLALTWIPCTYTEGVGDEMVKVRGSSSSSSNSNEKSILCIEETACYVNDREMEGFVQACVEHYLDEGQGIAGRALQSNHPFFFPDVKEYDITQYPLVHHARKYGLNSAVAIRLRSTYTGDDDYILEFFLPKNMTGSSEQQLLLNYLSGTMHRLCRSLRTVSDKELGGFQNGGVLNFESMGLSKKNPKRVLSESDLNMSNSNGTDTDNPREQVGSGSRKQAEKKRSPAEKTVSLTVLQQYFSGSLKDAAKSIGVCPTTLKRICRQHGILRWPSRKINKVNRSLRKIQSVLDSVQGVEGRLKFDPTTGGLVATSSLAEDFDAPNTLLFPNKTHSVATEPRACLETNFSIPTTQDLSLPTPPCMDGENSDVKLEEDDSYMKNPGPQFRNGEQNKTHNHIPNSTQIIKISAEISGNSSGGSYFTKEENINDSGMKIESFDMDGDDGNHPSSSGMTDSSSGSGSLLNSSSSSPSVDGLKELKPKTTFGEVESRLTVKATYKEDTIRFKFDPIMGIFQLYEEVGKRFKLQNGTFQLKYLDDEKEWVLLVSDSDLQECVEILEYLGLRSVKFLVRDLPCSMGGSSGGSNCFLTPGS